MGVNNSNSNWRTLITYDINSLLSDSLLNIDASLPTSGSSLYGYNRLSGGKIIELSNLSDVSLSTNPVGSADLDTINGLSAISLLIPATPLFIEGRGFTSSLDYSVSSTQSSYFCVTSQVDTGDSSNTISVIRPLGTDGNVVYNSSKSAVWQANKTNSTINSSFAGSYGATVSLMIINGSTTETNVGTSVKMNGTSWVRSSSSALGDISSRGITSTSLLNYFINVANAGKKLSFHQIIYFDRLLSSIEVTLVEDYLKSKWGITY